MKKRHCLHVYMLSYKVTRLIIVTIIYKEALSLRVVYVEALILDIYNDAIKI